MNSGLKEINRNICLIVVCAEEIALAIAPHCPERFLRYANCRFDDEGFGDLTGFYDWLRNAEGLVIGVRYLPADELNFLLEELSELPYAEVDWRIRSVEFYFSRDRSVDASISNDQEFGDNRLLRSSSGTIAISFNAGAAIDSFDSETKSKISSIES